MNIYHKLHITYDCEYITCIIYSHMCAFYVLYNMNNILYIYDIKLKMSLHVLFSNILSISYPYLLFCPKLQPFYPLTSRSSLLAISPSDGLCSTNLPSFT